MASEKTQALYIPTDSYEGKTLKEKEKETKKCTKFILYWVLASFLIALVVGLCVQFLVPAYEKRNKTDKIRVHFEETSTRGVHHEAFTEETKDDGNLPWHLDFLINPTRLCDTKDNPKSDAYQNNPEVKLLVLVPSATSHFAHRKTIRKTWGSAAENPHGPMRLGFVLGTTPNSTEESLIRHESEVFGDIVQADFEDTYGNLTTKSVMMLKWVSKYCTHAQYFLKTDDDTFVNLPNLVKLLQKPEYDPEDDFIGGFVHRGATPIRIPAEKYYVSEDDYPEEEFPPYTSGSAYMTTGNTASKLFDASQRVTPFLPLEDVFITGLCADDIGAKLIHDPSFHFGRPEGSKWDSFSSIATAHNMAPLEIDLVWDQMTKTIMDAFNMMDSSSIPESVDSFGPISISDLLDWPVGKSMFQYESSDTASSMSGQDNLQAPGLKSIFDIMNLVKNKIEQSQKDGSFEIRVLDPGSVDIKGNVDGSFLLNLPANGDTEEPLALP